MNLHNEGHTSWNIRREAIHRSPYGIEVISAFCPLSRERHLESERYVRVRCVGIRMISRCTMIASLSALSSSCAEHVEPKRRCICSIAYDAERSDDGGVRQAAFVGGEIEDDLCRSPVRA